MIRKIGLLLSSSFINSILLFLFSPYLTRAIPLYDYANYAQVIFLGDLFFLLFSIPQTSTFFTLLHSPHFKTNEVINTFAGITLLSSILGTFLLYLGEPHFASFFNNESLNGTLVLYSPFVFLNSFLQYFTVLLLYKKKNKLIWIVSLFQTLGRIVILLFIIKYTYHINLLIIGSLVALVISVFIQFIICYADFEIKFTLAKKILKLVLPQWIMGILGSSYLYCSGLIISNNMSAVQFAIYKIGTFEIPLLGNVYSSISWILLPTLSEYFFKNKLKEIIDLKQQIIFYTSLLIYPICIYILINSAEIIQLLFGSNFEQSAYVFATFNLIILFRLTDYQDILLIAEKQKLLLYIYVVYFIVSIVSNLFLIKYFGIVGGSISAFLSVLSSMLMQQYFVNKLLNTSFLELFKPLQLSILCIGCTILALFLNIIAKHIPLILYFVTSGSIFIGLIVFIYWKLGFWNTLKNIILKLEN